jgi:hypothetical protein
MRRAPHPLFSLDFTPSDFYLFGKVKTALMAALFSDANELFHSVRNVLSGISSDEPETIVEN